MVNTSFFGAYLRGADLSGANMQGAYLNLARLEGTNLSGANLTDAIIFQAIFSKTNFKGANLTNARMIGTLGNVDMSEANVTKGRFGLDVGNQPMGQMKFDSVGGNFTNTNFAGADLNIANFSFGNLQGANLSNTNLHRADLSQADLRSERRGLDRCQCRWCYFQGCERAGLSQRLCHGQRQVRGLQAIGFSLSFVIFKTLLQLARSQGITAVAAIYKMQVVAVVGLHDAGH